MGEARLEGDLVGEVCRGRDESLAGELGDLVENFGLGMSSRIERMGLCSAGVVLRLPEPELEFLRTPLWPPPDSSDVLSDSYTREKMTR